MEEERRRRELVTCRLTEVTLSRLPDLVVFLIREGEIEGRNEKYGGISRLG